MGEVFDSIVRGMNEAVDHAKEKPVGRRAKVQVRPAQDFDANKVKAIRGSTGMTQVIFAASLGVSPKTVEAWERGRNQPDGAARRLLEVVQADPTFLERFRSV